MNVNPVSEEVLIEDYLCLALYSASRAVTGLYRELLDELGLTYPQYLVMRVLWQCGPRPVGDIAEILQLDYGTLSPLLKRLETAGLVRRKRRTDDERSVEITLTDDGEAMREKAADVPARLTCAFGLSDDDQGKLREMLKRLNASIGANGQ
jgi:MarR family transcriptional regulator, organic hydroperoxide resistance regulator